MICKQVKAVKRRMYAEIGLGDGRTMNETCINSALRKSRKARAGSHATECQVTVLLKDPGKNQEIPRHITLRLPRGNSQKILDDFRAHVNESCPNLRTLRAQHHNKCWDLRGKRLPCGKPLTADNSWLWKNVQVQLRRATRQNKALHVSQVDDTRWFMTMCSLVELYVQIDALLR